MPVTRIKSYHSLDAVKNAQDYQSNTEKTDISGLDLSNAKEVEDSDLLMKHAFAYAFNDKKTAIDDKELLNSGVSCKIDLAVEDFRACRDLYHSKGHKEHTRYAVSRRPLRAKLDEEGNPIMVDGQYVYDEKSPVLKDAEGKVVFEKYLKAKEPRTAYMWVMSFPGEKELGYKIDPRLVHEIGRRFAKEYLGDYACTISTHVNTDHYHSHILQCAYSLDGSHKYRDTMDAIREAREYVDNLSQELGVPIILSPKTEKGISWFEWKMKREGESWKETVRQDIRDAMSISSSFQEYKENMEAAGYTLRETEHHITYYMPCSDGGIQYRIRDTRLNIAEDGHDFTKDGIISALEGKPVERQERPVREITKDITIDEHISLKVPKYTLNGRKRTVLEMIVLKAIKIIQFFKDMYLGKNPSNSHSPVYRKSEDKLHELRETLSILESRGFSGIDELHQEMTKAGAELSHAKKTLKELDTVYPKQKEVLERIKLVKDELDHFKEKGISIGDLSVYTYTKEEIQQNRAHLSPMTAQQKRELYVRTSEDSLYTVNRKFDTLTYDEARQAINFLEKRTNIRPDCLSSKIEHSSDDLIRQYDRIRDNRDAKMKEKYSDTPLSETQKTFIESKGISPDGLSYYDGLRLNIYFDRNVFDSPILDDKAKEDLISLIKSHGDTSVRQTLTEADKEAITSYYQTGGAKPDVIGEAKPATESAIGQVKDLLRIRGEKTTVPVEELTMPELYRLNSYLLFKGSIPEAMTGSIEEQRSEKDEAFIDRISALSLSEQERVSDLRDNMNFLAGIGINPDKFTIEEMKIEEVMEEREKAKEAVDVKSTEYKTLKRLDYNISLAQNTKFTHGPLYNKKDISEEIKETEERGQESQKEQKSYSKTDKYFDSIS